MNKEEWDQEVDRVVQELSMSMHDKMGELARTMVVPGIFEAAICELGCTMVATSLASMVADERETGLECTVDLIRSNLELLDAKKGETDEPARDV